MAEPEKIPRQNNMVIRSAEMSRVKMPADDQLSAAIPVRIRPRRWDAGLWEAAVVTIAARYQGVNPPPSRKRHGNPAKAPHLTARGPFAHVIA